MKQKDWTVEEDRWRRTISVAASRGPKGSAAPLLGDRVGQRALITTQRGLPDGSLAERFGALEFRFHLRVTQGAMTYVQTGAAVTVGRLRVPLPRWIAPRVEAREACIDGDTPFVTVGISSPLIGVVMSYEGCIQVERP